MLLNKPLGAIQEADLQALVDDRISEQKLIEYKEALPGEKESDKIKFLAHISSFANTNGGHLIYGIWAENGIPKELRGMQIDDMDGAILRLRHLISNGLAPTLRTAEVQEVALPSKPGYWAIVIQIRKSWAMPHMVTIYEHGKFYARDERGRRTMKVDELREAFTLGGITAERIRKFHAQRLSLISGGETPILMDEKAPKLILHICPFSAFDSTVKFNLSSLTKTNDTNLLTPLTRWPNPAYPAPRYNLDGLLSHSMPGGNLIHSYLQVFRDGSIEAVDTSILMKHPSEHKGLSGAALDIKLIVAVSRYLHTQRELGVEPPLVIMVSMLGVKGYTIEIDPARGFNNTYPIDRPDLIIPETLYDGSNPDVSVIIRPILDTIWNAAGWERSMSYDEWGKFKFPLS